VHRLVALLFIAVCTSAPAGAQIAADFALPRPAECCLAGAAERLADQLQDWNQLGRYHTANIELKRRTPEPARVVFMGDSITDGWALDTSFPGKPYVNRGIGGQTTAQMLVRVFPDVIALEPAAVIILAGTNDIARNNGPQTLEMIQQNLIAMTELAKAHHIKVILCSVLPITDATTGQNGAAINQSARRPPADILTLNAWLAGYARSIGAGFADYYTATVDDKGLLRADDTSDGLHPNAAGYALMTPVAAAAIAKTLR
jgi:lysophospholipase L1-like esterase